MKTMNILATILTTFVLALPSFIFPGQALAADDNIRCNSGSGILSGVNTAIGCIGFLNTQDLTSFILRWAIGIGGGIAFILIVVAGAQIMMSGGDPKKLQSGKELLTSAIVGLLLIIFSIFLLRILGVDIFGIFS